MTGVGSNQRGETDRDAERTTVATRAVRGDDVSGEGGGFN